MAEGEGFEPPLPVKVKQFSRLPVSTTHTSLRSGVRACFYLKDISMAFCIQILPCYSTGFSRLYADCVRIPRFGTPHGRREMRAFIACCAPAACRCMELVCAFAAPTQT